MDVGWRGRRDSNPAVIATNHRRLNSLSLTGRVLVRVRPLEALPLTWRTESTLLKKEA
jgi:hypothetical protein